MRVFACEGEANRLKAIIFFAFAMIVGCHQQQREHTVLTHRETQIAIAGLRVAYAAFNRNDIDTAVRSSG
jgi:hypothetical protein